MAEP
ncbi:hypothetical protein FFLO_02853 [Filobasidium floriforme]|jgi:hypothetical protein